jgi:hypothetical protein
MRDTARQSAAVLTQYRTGFAKFASEQTELNGAIQAGIQHLNSMRDERRTEIASRTRAWKLARRKETLEELALLTEVDGQSLLAQVSDLQNSKPASAPAVMFDPAAVNGIIKQLLLLEKPREMADRATEILQFTSKLRDAMDEDIEQASENTDAATAETRENADAVAAGATPQ